MNHTFKGKRTGEIAFFVSFLSVFCFLLWKCRFGFGYDDEGFYLTTPMRLWLGDALFTHEWHLSQMSWVLPLPFVAAFLSLTGSTVGIILTFRYLFTVVQAVVALFLYYRLKKTDWFGAAFASLCFLIYTPYNIPALCYNSLGIITLTLSTVILYTARKNRPVQLICAGLLLACAVLCCPYLVLVYGYFAASAMVKWYRGRDRQTLTDMLWLTAGCGVAAVLFALFVLSRASLGQILRNFPMLFQDPEHMSRSLSSMVKSYIQEIIYCGGAYSIPLGLTMAAGFLAALVDRKHRIGVPLFVLGCLLTLCYMKVQLEGDTCLNYVMFPLNLLALYCLPLTRDKRVWPIFFTIYIPGMLYSFCIHCTSNQAYYIISNASAVALIGSIFIILFTARELAIGKSWRGVLVTLALCSVFLTQLGSELYLRYDTIFSERHIADQTVLVTVGPEKGLLAEPEIAEDYTAIYTAVTQNPAYQQAGSVLYLTKHPWMYLFDVKQSSAFSGWLSGVNSTTITRLNAYYTLNPEKIPDCIIALAKDAYLAENLEILPDYTMEPVENLIIWSKLK